MKINYQLNLKNKAQILSRYVKGLSPFLTPLYGRAPLTLSLLLLMFVYMQMSEMLAQRLSGVDVGKPGEEGEGGDSVVWRETVSMQLSNEEVNLALGPGGAMAFRVGHGDGFDTDEVRKKETGKKYSREALYMKGG